MNLIGSKKIETERLILRPTNKEDIKILWQILSISNVNKYYLTCKINKTWEEELPWQLKKLKHANDKDVFQWSIILKNNNECIGQISVQKKESDPTIRDIGWFINPKFQKKGYAYEAAENIIRYMFEEVEINAIETSSAIYNKASLKLMEKFGFTKRTENTHINNYTFTVNVESYCYGLSKTEYERLKQLNNIKTVEDILNFMKNNINYGYIDINGEKHIKEMKNFRKLYRTSTIQKTLEIGLGTCIEQVNLMHFICNKNNIKSKMFCTRIFEPDDYGNLEEEEHMHCFLLVYINNKVFHIEHPNWYKIGIYEYKNQNQAINEIQKYYINLSGGKPRPVTEFYEVKQGLTFKEFNSYINNIGEE